MQISTIKYVKDSTKWGFCKKQKNQTRLQLSNEKGLALFLKSSDPAPLPCPISFNENKHPYSSTLQSTKLTPPPFGLIYQKLLKFDLCTFKIFLNIMISIQTVI